ncbi:GP179 protein, partial [Nyctibius grandis]|nr:GP179 protein [Nyctibius grandis]
GDRLEGGSRSIHPPRDHAEVEQPQVTPTAGSPDPSVAGVQGAAAQSPGAAVCPWGAPGPPAGKGALLRQEAIASQEDVRVPPGEESPAKALEKGSSHPEPLGPRGSRGTRRVPPRSRSAEAAPAAVGRAGSVAGREVEVGPGETQADASIKIEICPWEESEGGRRGPGRAPGEGGSGEDPLCPGEELGMEKPAAKPPELLKVALEKAEGRRAEVCPWESGEGGTVRAEICPWDGSSQRGSPSPGEGPGMGLVAKHPALPKTSSKQAGTIDSKKATVCPWEVEDEPLPKAEICPWEEPAAPSGKERPGEDTRGTSKGENKPGRGGLEDVKAKLAETGDHRPER